MRQITPLDFPDLPPADLSGQRQPTWELVDPRDLYVEDDRYQRSTDTLKSMTAIGRIRHEFRWSRYKAVTCVWVDGRLVVVDGQHTATACASHPEITAIPVLIVDEPELVERARAFVSHARDRLTATPGQVWRALVEAGEEEAVGVLRVCSAAGVTMMPFPPAGGVYKPGETIALQAVKALIRREGEEQAALTLAALADTGMTPITADAIKAAEVLLCDPEYESEFDTDRLSAAFRALSPKAMAEAKALAAAKGLPMWRALAAVVYKHRGKVKATTAIAKPAKALPPVSAPQPTTGTARFSVRVPEQASYSAGDPLPGRSALDQRRATA